MRERNRVASGEAQAQKRLDDLEREGTCKKEQLDAERKKMEEECARDR